MANKNKNLIIAYFPNEEAAKGAGHGMKDWDKARKDIKLGGMGIVTMEDGKLKTKKVGARAGGTGAKWGIILGTAAGILSGGVTLVGGAIAGLTAGAIGGSLFHKKLGMTDDDKMRLQMHLQEGGAALAVMVDDDEMAPTRMEMDNLGGEVEHYVVPDETMDELEETATDVEDVDEDEVIVVETFEEDDLVLVKGIGQKYADLLTAAGVEGVADLAMRHPENLVQKLADVNEAQDIVKELPSDNQLADWVAQAKEMSA